MPYPARRVSDIDGTWLYDTDTFNVFGENASTLNLSYEVRAFDVTPTAEELRAAADTPYPTSLRRYLETPSSLPALVEQEARRVIGDRTNGYDQALAIQDWLRSDEFDYSTEVARRSVTPAAWTRSPGSSRRGRATACTSRRRWPSWRGCSTSRRGWLSGSPPARPPLPASSW